MATTPITSIHCYRIVLVARYGGQRGHQGGCNYKFSAASITKGIRHAGILPWSGAAGECRQIKFSIPKKLSPRLTFSRFLSADAGKQVYSCFTALPRKIHSCDSADDLTTQRRTNMYTNRREFLKAAAALLAAAAAQQGRFAFAGGSNLQSVADALLAQAAENGDVPGVIAAATTRNDTIYEGAF